MKASKVRLTVETIVLRNNASLATEGHLVKTKKKSNHLKGTV